MNQYETVFICKPDLPAEKLTSITERVKSIITQSGGRISSLDEWGKRRLSYPIKKQIEGTYTLVCYVSEGDIPKKIEAYFVINEDVLRHLTIRKEKTSKTARVVKQEEKPEIKEPVAENKA